MLAPATPPAPTHHATVIVPAPAQTAQPHHVTVVTMGPTSVINSVSTSRQNLDTIVQVSHALKKTVAGRYFKTSSSWTLEGAFVADLSLDLLVLPGDPTHRGHPGERLWGRAAKSGYRHLRTRPLWCGGLRYRLKQRWARWLFTALSSTLKPCVSHSYIHTPTHKYTNTQKRPKQTSATRAYKVTAPLFCGQGW